MKAGEGSNDGTAMTLRRVFIVICAWLIVAPPFCRATIPRAEMLSAPSDIPPRELERIARPFALYPDTLLQNILAAATFPEQILDAALFHERGSDPRTIKDQPWDDSVKNAANFPSVLSKLADDIDGTIALGTAFINQNEALRETIQKLRARAQKAGNLKDTDRQHVIVEQGPNGREIIRIESTDPDSVYVPSSTVTIYDRPADDLSSLWIPLTSFGLGMALGYALGEDDHYYYGGFYGPGFWYGGPAFYAWSDYRFDKWHHHYDYAWDHRHHPSRQRDEWDHHRRGLDQKRSEWRHARAAHSPHLTPERRAAVSTHAREQRALRERRFPADGRASLRPGTIAQPQHPLSMPRPPGGYNRGGSPRLSLHHPAPPIRERTADAPPLREIGGAPARRGATPPLGRGSSLAGIGQSRPSVSRESAWGAASRRQAATPGGAPQRAGRAAQRGGGAPGHGRSGGLAFGSRASGGRSGGGHH